MVINVLERFPDLFSFYSHEMTPYSLNLVVIFYVSIVFENVLKKSEHKHQETGA